MTKSNITTLNGNCINIYSAHGVIANCSEPGFSGVGSVLVQIYSNNIAIVDFMFRIVGASENDGSIFSYGLNRDLLSRINPNIPRIITQSGGIMYFYRDDILMSECVEYSGTSEGNNGNFWTPARVYETAGTIGAWSDNHWMSGDYITGRVYGIVA